MKLNRLSVVLGLAALTVFSPIVSQGIALGWYWPPTGGMSMTPPCPTSEDQVSISLAGEWPHTCIPNASDIWSVGNEIYFEAILDYPPDAICLAIIMPWSLTESIGPLAPGTYTVYASLYHVYFGQQFPPTFVGTVAVHACGDVNCDSEVNGLDIEAFTLAFLDPDSYATAFPDCDISSADFDGDCEITVDDMEAFVDFLLGV